MCCRAHKTAALTPIQHTVPLPTHFLRLCKSKGRWSKKSQKHVNVVFEQPRNRLLEIDILLPLVTSIAISVTVTSDIKPKCQSAIYLTEGKVKEDRKPGIHCRAKNRFLDWKSVGSPLPLRRRTACHLCCRFPIKCGCCNWLLGQRYTYRVLQTIQMRPILICVWAEPAVFGSTIKTALNMNFE